MNAEQELAYWRERATFEEWFTKTKAYIDSKHIITQVIKDIAWEAWQAAKADCKCRGGAVKVNAVFETQVDEVIGKTEADVKRVEWQDDGSLTVVIDYWPQPTEPPSVIASQPAESEELIDAASQYARAYDGDDRQDIAIDVINAFYQGACWKAAHLAEPDKQHPDDVAVDAFAAAMKAKLKRARDEKGRGGWQDMSAAELSAMLRVHVGKGDPIDVANLAMILHQNGQRIEPLESQRIDDVLRGLQASVAVGSDGAWVSIRREARGAAVKLLQELNTGSQGRVPSAGPYSGCGCNSDDCRVNGCLSKRQAQSAMVPGGGSMPTEPVKHKRRYAQGTALGEFGIIPMCDQVDEPVKVPPATS